MDGIVPALIRRNIILLVLQTAHSMHSYNCRFKWVLTMLQHFDLFPGTVTSQGIQDSSSWGGPNPRGSARHPSRRKARRRRRSQG